jgi:hypothetical protein
MYVLLPAAFTAFAHSMKVRIQLLTFSKGKASVIDE